MVNIILFLTSVQRPRSIIDATELLTEVVRFIPKGDSSHLH